MKEGVYGLLAATSITAWTSLCPASYVAVNVSLFAHAARRCTAVDRYILPAQRSAANPPHVVAASDGMDGERQTDERTPDIFISNANKIDMHNVTSRNTWS